MSGSLGTVFLLSLTAMANPSLLAAVTAMLLLPNPKRLMFGYLLGAYLTSITMGLLIVFTLQGSATESTSKHTVGPLQDIVVGVIMLLLAYALATNRDEPLRERRERRRERKAAEHPDAKPPLSQRLLDRGSARVSFVVGALLSFPGFSYLYALDQIVHLNYSDGVSVVIVVCFCVIQLALLELPLLGYVFRPERTQQAVESFRAFLGRDGRSAAVIVLIVLGGFAITHGVIGLLV